MYNVYIALLYTILAKSNEANLALMLWKMAVSFGKVQILRGFIFEKYRIIMSMKLKNIMNIIWCPNHTWWPMVDDINMMMIIYFMTHSRQDTQSTGHIWQAFQIPNDFKHHYIKTHIAKFMGPTSCRPQMGPMLAPWTLLSGDATDMK